MAKEPEVVVGLDIGTTKICAVVAESNDYDEIRVIGIGTTVSKGLRKGVVVDIESTVESVGKAVEEAEQMANVEIHSVFSGISGGHISGMNSRGVVPVQGKKGEISEDDVQRAVDSAKAISIPMDREVIHTIPQQFIVDGQDGVKDPRGMSGVRLEAEVHVVTGAITSAQNIIKSINRAGLEVEDIVLEPLASSLAVLTPEEKANGVVLVDIGGGTTDVVCFVNGVIHHTSVFSIGGDHLTNDISIGLRIPVSKAEEIKKKFGCAMGTLVKEGEEFVVPGIVGRAANNMPRRILAELIELRMEELFTLIKDQLKRSNISEFIGSGIVITGGTALLVGLNEMARKIFDVPVRIGRPTNVSGLVDILDSPIYSTGVGLVQYGFKHRRENGTSRFRGRNIFEKIVGRMREWVGEVF